MDNGTVKKRDLKAPGRDVNKRSSPWWPVMIIFGLVVVAFTLLFTGIKKKMMALFKKKKSIKGKVVVITGAGRGLGRGLALATSRLGAHVACVDVIPNTNEETVRLIKEEGGIAEAFTVNVAKSHQVEQLEKDVRAKLGPTDILINNAALLMAVTINEMTYEDIRAIFEVNCMGPIFMTKAFLPGMREKNSGHIVGISSIGAMTSVPFLSLYCSTKSALSRFHESLRVELDECRGNEVKVTAIHPFFINTSSDYTSWFETFVPILEEDYVVNTTIDSILYEKESVCIPSMMSLVGVTDSMLGSHQYNIAMKMIGKGIQLPSEQDRLELPYATIVSDITSTTSN